MKKSWRQRFQTSSAHTQASILFSAVIMVATCAYTVIAAWQLLVMRASSEDSSKQMQKLICAANINAAAAQKSAQAAADFAATAANINGSIGDAVTKLERQANATQTAAESSVSASRAWMVPEAYSTSVEPINLTWRNAGKTPALDISATAEYDMGGGRSLPSGCDRLKKSRWKADQSIALEGQPFVLTLQNVPPEWKEPLLTDNTAKLMSVHGCVWYRDVLTGRIRVTEFWLDAMRDRADRLADPAAQSGVKRPEVSISASLRSAHPLIFH